MSGTDARRRKTVALVLSGIFPGLGQLYNREPVKGVAFLAAGLLLTWLLGRAAPTDLRALARPSAALIAPLCALLVLSLWSLGDAWRRAGRPR